MDLAQTVAVLDAFDGAEVWVEEHGNAFYIIHLDKEVQEERADDGEKWIVVHAGSPLFAALRSYHKRANRLWTRLLRLVRQLGTRKDRVSL